MKKVKLWFANTTILKKQTITIPCKMFSCVMYIPFSSADAFPFHTYNRSKISSSLHVFSGFLVHFCKTENKINQSFNHFSCSFLSLWIWLFYDMPETVQSSVYGFSFSLQKEKKSRQQISEFILWNGLLAKAFFMSIRKFQKCQTPNTSIINRDLNLCLNILPTKIQ